jgi:hypothetical protein
VTTESTALLRSRTGEISVHFIRLLSLLGAVLVTAQSSGWVPHASAQESQIPAGTDRGSSLDLGISGIGLSFGSAPRWSGLRVNWRDRYLERIDGVNITLWKPGDHVGGAVNGLSLGLGPRAGYLRGVSIGLLGVLPERSAYGVTIGGLGIVADGSVVGLNLGLLGIVTEGRADGLSFAGLGLVSEGGALGINFAGLGVVSEGTVAGINLAGLGLVAERGIHGLNGALLGVVTEGQLRGITVTGLGAVAERDMIGLTIGGLGVVSDRAIQGVAAALLKVDTRELRGISIAGWTRVRQEQRGLSIGLFNQAEELHGVQLGVLNFAGNNHGLARWLPLINLHLN